MSEFLNAMKSDFNYTFTENSGITHKSTLNSVLDMFAMGGAMRNRSDEDVIRMFKKAYEEDATLALRVTHLEQLHTHDIEFTVKCSTDPVEGATVTLGKKTGTTASTGKCTIADVLEDTYEVEVTCEGYEDETQEITVTGATTSFNISLTAVTPGEE